jgi:hypothetical protein
MRIDYVERLGGLFKALRPNAIAEMNVTPIHMVIIKISGMHTIRMLDLQHVERPGVLR